MVIIGPEYEILAADVGMNGHMSDGGNWSRNKTKPKPLPDLPVPYVAVGDDAFALTTSLLKPYLESSLTTEKRIFNYRLSRARCISENVLGIMAQKWQVIRSVMRLEPEKATTVVLTIMALHNFLRGERCYVTVSDDELSSLSPATSWLVLPPLAKEQNYSNKAKAIRDEFCEYFNLQGAVSWQWKAARIDGYKRAAQEGGTFLKI